MNFTLSNHLKPPKRLLYPLFFSYFKLEAIGSLALTCFFFILNLTWALEFVQLYPHAALRSSWSFPFVLQMLGAIELAYRIYHKFEHPQFGVRRGKLSIRAKANRDSLRKRDRKDTSTTFVTGMNHNTDATELLATKAEMSRLRHENEVLRRTVEYIMNSLNASTRALHSEQQHYQYILHLKTCSSLMSLNWCRYIEPVPGKSPDVGINELDQVWWDEINPSLKQEFSRSRASWPRFLGSQRPSPWSIHTTL